MVLDTCALLWWTLDPGNLSPTALDACRQLKDGQGIVSSISVWEIGLKVKQGKLEIGMEMAEFVKRLKAASTIEIVAVDESIWMENLALAWEHRDPADRTIVATARLRKLPIVTPDRHITSFYPQIVW
jgi:PIN domain nuclease of toxin-antitoxin system